MKPCCTRSSGAGLALTAPGSDLGEAPSARPLPAAYHKGAVLVATLWSTRLALPFNDRPEGELNCKTVNEGRWCRSKACAGRMRSVSERHGCCTFEVYRLWLRTEARVRSRRLRTVLSWPSQIWGLCLIQQLTSFGVVETPRTD